MTPRPGDALTEVAQYLRCPGCAQTRWRTEADGLVCGACARRYPYVGGVLDMAAPGDVGAAGDRPYEGFWAAFYGWVMSSPARQRLDSWLLGLDVRRYYRETVARLDECGDGPRLEVPCGSLPFHGRTRAYDAGPWIFVDLSRAMLDKLARRLDGTGHVLVRADACALPVRDGQLRTIVSLFGLHCFHDKDAVFAELRRCLRPDGRLVLSTLTSDGPARSRLYQRLNELDGTFAPAVSSARIAALAGRHGLGIDDQVSLGSVLLCTASLRIRESTASEGGTR
ncbi:class I SAM-dependent methyltransferase [Solihabitans fulvus]|uniref:Class I SAM-dependent methyltransferase n=1 Tax=Solihabitans fulvus TaxID=1892852 RepID=A0A5B2WID3_9PSEU|nr:class I SAM-dependent methyltransferase [Solihabitans fulvus]KAA2250734.1 class I SAM-dependent methyltransferase [Solihabitans fulvus]